MNLTNKENDVESFLIFHRAYNVLVGKIKKYDTVSIYRFVVCTTTDSPSKALISCWAKALSSML